MKPWFDTFRSLFLRRWWWLPSVFFGPWWLSVALFSFVSLAMLLSAVSAGPNWALLIATALTGIWAGCWARRFHGWECTVLVGHLPRHLFVVSLGIVGGAALAFTAFSMYAGNPIPALGLALLVGVGAVYCAVRLPEWLAFQMFLGFLLLFVAWVDSGPAYWRMMSHPAVQVLSVASVLILLACLKHRLESPVVEQLSSTVRGQPPVGGLWRTSAILKRCSRMALTGFGLDMLITLLAGYPSLSFLERMEGPVFGYDHLLFTTGMIVMCPSVLTNVNEYPIAWLLGTGSARSRLAWSLVGRKVLIGVVPLLAFFIAVESLQSLAAGAPPRFDSLLKAQMLGFLAFGLVYAFRRKYPNRFLKDSHTLIPMIFFGLGAYPSALLDVGLPVLVLLVTGVAVLASRAVSYGLAHADYAL